MFGWLRAQNRANEDWGTEEEGGDSPASSREHLDYLDKLFFELFKKEIDQSENVWRTLPFFSATIALELAVFTQLRSDLWHFNFYVRLTAYSLIALFFLFIMMTLWFVYRSIRARTFVYLPSENELLGYVREMEKHVAGNPTSSPDSIKNDLQDQILTRLAEATVNNRAVNNLREQVRGRAVRWLIASVVPVLFLLALDVVSSHDTQEGQSNAAPSVSTDQSPSGQGSGDDVYSL